MAKPQVDELELVAEINDPNAWIRERADEFLEGRFWRRHDPPMLRFMIDEAGTAHAPAEVRSHTEDPAITAKTQVFSEFRKRLARHPVLGPELGDSGHGLSKLYWLGELIEVENVEPELVIEYHSYGDSGDVKVVPDVEVPGVDEQEIRRLVEKIVLGEPIKKDVTDVIPESYFQKHGRSASRGLHAALNNPDYPTSKNASENLARIGAVLRLFPWGK